MFNEVRSLGVLKPELHSSGLRTRLGTLRSLIGGRSSHSSPRKPCQKILVDHNDRKSPHACRTFNAEVELVNPLDLRLTMRHRLALLLCICVPSSAWQVLAALVLARNLRARIEPNTQLYLWNPYSLLQYAVAVVIDIEATYHLSPRYPMVPNVRKALGNEEVLRIIGYPIEKAETSRQEMEFTEATPVFRIYLTKLETELRSERGSRMLTLLESMAGYLSLPPEVFLHYSDRDLSTVKKKYPEFYDRFGPYIRTEHSLSLLSAKQISVTSSSTIGYELAAVLTGHFFVIDDAVTFLGASNDLDRRVRAWRQNYGLLLDLKESNNMWLSTLRRFDAETGLGVFLRSSNVDR